MPVQQEDEPVSSTATVSPWEEWSPDAQQAAVDAAQDALMDRGEGLVSWRDMQAAIRAAIDAAVAESGSSTEGGA